MSAYRPGSEIFGANEEMMDHISVGDSNLDMWLGRTKKNEKSQNNFSARSKSSGTQKADFLNRSPQPLPLRTSENIWDAQKRQEKAHTSTFSNSKTAYIDEHRLSDGRQSDRTYSSPLVTRIDNDDPSVAAHEAYPNSKEMPFVVKSTMPNVSFPSQPTSQVGVDESMRQRNTFWPQKQVKIHEGQKKRVSFESTEKDAAHSLDKPIVQPNPIAAEQTAFSFPTRNVEERSTLKDALKHMHDIQQTSVSCLQEVQALIYKESEACKQYSDQIVDFKARIGFLETLCGEKEHQNKQKDDALINKDAQLENKDDQIAHKDAQLERKDAQLLAKDGENLTKRQSLDEFRLKLEKVKEACEKFLLDGNHISKEWEDLKLSVKADWRNLKEQLDVQKALNKDLTDGFERLKSKQEGFKNQLNEFATKVMYTEGELQVSKDSFNTLSAKFRAVNDDAHKAQQEFERKLEEKDNEVQIAEAAHQNIKQTVLQLQKELENAKTSSSTKMNELITADNKIKQMQESFDELEKRFNEHKRMAHENKIKMDQCAKESELKAHENRIRMEEKAKANERMAKEVDEKTRESENLKREKESVEVAISLLKKEIVEREEGMKVREDKLKAREDNIKAREEAHRARGEGTSKVRKDAPERDQDSVKGRSTTTQSNDDSKNSKSSTTSRKKARLEPPSMDSD